MGIPLRSASTMSLPEGVSCECGLLGYPSGPNLPPQIGPYLHIGTLPQMGPPSSDGASIIRLTPASFWASSLSWASPLRLDCMVELSLHLPPRPHLSVG